MREDVLVSLAQRWKNVFPNRPFDFFFVDEDYARQYDAALRLGTVFGWFTALAILLACLGLFGLVSFTTQQRTKEIGVRKVLGASAGSLAALLTKDFARLVGIAFLVAVPLAYVVMNRWLESFAYHIDIGPGVFLLAGALALVIALLTVSYQAVKAARTDPVQTLRYE